MLTSIVTNMTDAIIHRGPDDSGIWIDENTGVALGHRRLSIIDVSSHGHQPMASASGRYVIVYNGEIYNFPDIKAELDEIDRIDWRGHSDTEVVLEAIERFGIKGALERFNGMFAFALWDKKEKTLTFARDRLGKKPLYYGFNNGILWFSSELKSFFSSKHFSGEVNRDSLSLYLRYNYVPAPYSVLKGINKLPQSTYVVIPCPPNPSRHIAPVLYWSAKDVYGEPIKDLSREEAHESLKELLLDTVKIRMISDVPLGAFLSGGIDSSLVVALMQAQSAKPVRTFSIGFHEDGYNEAVYAKDVAKHLGTDHTELYVTPDEARSVIPNLPSLYDEPFADSSQIPTHLVSKMARDQVTVCLSGDGGDESFGGYNRYVWAMKIWRRVGWAPAWSRAMAASAITSVPPSLWDGAFKLAGPLVPGSLKYSNPGDKAHKLAEILDLSGPVETYRWLVSQFKAPENIVLNGREPKTTLSSENDWARVDDFSKQMMYLDTMTYLPDDILVKVDRASMGVSLEVRCPLLDYRVIEAAATLPMEHKLNGSAGKVILRDILFDYVPRELIERPKMGFGVPIDSWLRGPLREWAEELLDEGRLRREGYLEPTAIRKMWNEHLSGARNYQYPLWTIIMFQQWLESSYVN